MQSKLAATRSERQRACSLLFALTNTPVHFYLGPPAPAIAFHHRAGCTDFHSPMPTSTHALRQTVQQVQVAFPQIYLACHTRHQRKRSTVHQLSARDGSILSHLDEHFAITPAKLAAQFLGIARSTLSEALKKLHALGYVAAPDGDGRRRNSVVLTKRGASAISDTSVLETPLLMNALAKASSRELRVIANGLNLLAVKCRGEKQREVAR